MTTYIEEIIDNFYNTRLAERIVFLEILNEPMNKQKKLVKKNIHLDGMGQIFQLIESHNLYY